MESSGASIGKPRRSQPGAVRVTQIGVLVASLGAVLVVFDPFGLAGAGIFLAIGGALLAAPGGLGRGWYFVVAGGAIGVAVSRLIAESAEVAGGWLAVIAAIAILIGATLGYPVRSDSD
jgi:hypothetical protein